MIIWVITIGGEQFPEVDGKDVRVWRSVMLSQELIKQGHSIVRWASTFDHHQKKHRFQADTDIQVNNQYQLRFLKSFGYKKNISFKRIADHYFLAHKFKRKAAESPKPDIILCSLPILELCKEATLYGKKHRVPVVLDGRDMWPDIFVDVFPKRLRFLSKIALYPMFKMVEESCRAATALTGISEPYIEWQLNYANRHRNKFDKAFPMAYTDSIPSESSIEIANKYWDSVGVDSKGFYVCLFASFEQGFDIDTIIEAAKELEQKKSDIKFILCGKGSRLEEYKSKSLNCNNIYFSGWVDFSKIWTLMRRSAAGVLPYMEKDNFLLNIPNKPIEYLSAGLPLISSIKGLIGTLIENNQCGVFYSSSEELTQQVMYLQKNERERISMSINSKHLYENFFIAEKVYAEMATYLIDIAIEYKKTSLSND